MVRGSAGPGEALEARDPLRGEGLHSEAFRNDKIGEKSDLIVWNEGNPWKRK